MFKSNSLLWSSDHGKRAAWPSEAHDPGLEESSLRQHIFKLHIKFEIYIYLICSSKVAQGAMSVLNMAWWLYYIWPSNISYMYYIWPLPQDVICVLWYDNQGLGSNFRTSMSPWPTSTNWQYYTQYTHNWQHFQKHFLLLLLFEVNVRKNWIQNLWGKRCA